MEYRSSMKICSPFAFRKAYVPYLLPTILLPASLVMPVSGPLTAPMGTTYHALGRFSPEE